MKTNKTFIIVASLGLLFNTIEANDTGKEQEERAIRDAMAVNQMIVAWTDLNLDLTPEQRRKVAEKLGGDSGKSAKKRGRAESMELIHVQDNKSMSVVAFPLGGKIDAILTPSQTTLWNLLAPKKINNAWDEEEDWIEGAEEILQALKQGRLGPEDAKLKIDELRKKWDKDEEDFEKEEDLKLQEDLKRRRSMVEEKLEVVEEKIKADFEAGKVNKQDAAKKFRALKEKLVASKDDDEFDRKDDREVRFNRAAGAIKKAIAAGRLTEEEADARIRELKERIWADEKEDKRFREDRDSGEIQGRDKLIVEARLDIHTEQLGELDARAIKRLVLVKKGVVQQYLEQNLEEKTRDEAALRDLKEEWIEDEDAVQSRGDLLLITNHPLYQGTLKMVLSSEAYEKYQAHQKERMLFRQRARRDLVVAGFDSYLMFSDRQRGEMLTIAMNSPSILGGNVSGTTRMLQCVDKVRDMELSPGQKQKLNDLNAELGWAKKKIGWKGKKNFDDAKVFQKKIRDKKLK